MITIPERFSEFLSAEGFFKGFLLENFSPTVDELQGVPKLNVLPIYMGCRRIHLRRLIKKLRGYRPKGPRKAKNLKNFLLKMSEFIHFLQKNSFSERFGGSHGPSASIS